MSWYTPDDSWYGSQPQVAEMRVKRIKPLSITTSCPAPTCLSKDVLNHLSSETINWCDVFIDFGCQIFCGLMMMAWLDSSASCLHHSILKPLNLLTSYLSKCELDVTVSIAWSVLHDWLLVPKPNRGQTQAASIRVQRFDNTSIATPCFLFASLSIDEFNVTCN